MGASSPLLIALVGAIAVTVPSLLTFWFQAYRHRRLGPREEEDLVTRTAKQAVEMMDEVIEAARQERTDLLTRMTECETKVRELTAENTDLRAQITQLRSAQT